MGDGEVRRFIAKSTQMLMGHTNTEFSVQTPSNRQKTQVPDPQNPLGPRMLTLVHLYGVKSTLFS